MATNPKTVKSQVISEEEIRKQLWKTLCLFDKPSNQEVHPNTTHDSIEDLLDNLRVYVLYQNFEVESLRREKEHLIKLLEGNREQGLNE